jgi:hypothetical protein
LLVGFRRRGNQRKREYFENLDVDEWIILKEVINK